MSIRKGQLGEPEVDFTPVAGAAAISLATRLTIECFSLAGQGTAVSTRRVPTVSFVPRMR